jgi:hypothetical protein
MNDRDVRKALHTKLVREHRGEPDTFMIQEMTIPRGSARIDLAVVNGLLHGYEIKSDLDTLDRLISQRDAYCRVFDRVTLVVGEKLLKDAIEFVPEWWGIRVARIQAGAVCFHDLKLSMENPSPEPSALVRLLWKTEATRLLTELGLSARCASKSRKSIHQILIDKMPIEVLRSGIRSCLKERRSGVKLELCDD